MGLRVAQHLEAKVKMERRRSEAADEYVVHEEHILAAPQRPVLARATAAATSAPLPIDPAVDHVRGVASGCLIVEYGDYQCPYSRQAYRAVHLLENVLGDAVWFAFRRYPMDGLHPRAFAAAAAAEAAGLQGCFWQMHDVLFQRQHALSDRDLCSYAAELGLDLDAFDVDRQSPRVRERIVRDADARDAAGLRCATPTLIVDRVLLSRPLLAADVLTTSQR